VGIIWVGLLKPKLFLKLLSIVCITMTIFNTNNKKVIAYYQDYLKIKQLIDELKLLEKYLFENRIIKQSKTYTVFADDKFTYSTASKLEKILLRDYITNEQQEVFVDIAEKYYNYKLDLEDNNLIYFVRAKNHYYLEDLTRFRFSVLIELKGIVKALIKAELNNMRICPNFQHF
jgi:predicted transcriptional regulator